MATGSGFTFGLRLRCQRLAFQIMRAQVSARLSGAKFERHGVAELEGLVAQGNEKQLQAILGPLAASGALGSSTGIHICFPATTGTGCPTSRKATAGSTIPVRIHNSTGNAAATWSWQWDSSTAPSPLGLWPSPGKKTVTVNIVVPSKKGVHSLAITVGFGAGIASVTSNTADVHV